MSLNQHANNEKAFVWSTLCDFSDGEPRPETFCIRFGSVDNAQKFKSTFNEAKEAAAGIKCFYDKMKDLALEETEDSSDDESDAEDDETTDQPENGVKDESADPTADSKTEDQTCEETESEKPEVDQLAA